MKELIVFNTARGIRQFFDNQKDGFMPKTTTMSEFFDNFVYNKVLLKASNINRIFYMQEAIAKTKEIQRLHFSSEFFEFLKNVDHIFKFFKEITNQLISVNNILEISSFDTYAEFDEHIEILDNLFNNYRNILLSHNEFDDITLPLDYEINYSKIKEFDIIKFHLDGVFTPFELDVLNKISSVTQVSIITQTSKFNSLKNFSFIDVDNYKKISINLSDKSYKVLSDITKQIANVTALKSRSEQVGFIFYKVNELLNSGISEDEIFVITPDEEFNQILKIHDFNNIFNFAAGLNIKDSDFYQVFDKILEILKDKTFNKIPNFDQNQDSFEKTTLFFKSFKIPYSLLQKFHFSYNNDTKFLTFDKLIKELLEICNKNSLKLDIERILYEISFYDIDIKELFEIFYIKLNELKIPHATGGKISVIGLLEAREIKPKGLIIIDFNDGIVPKNIGSDIFLNSKIRSLCGLITNADRLNLQKFYYEKLINSSSMCYISYVDDEINRPSNFLKQLNVKPKDNNIDFLKIFPTYNISKENLHGDEICGILNISNKPISFSMLDTFLKCRRKFYYKYIDKILEPKSFDSDLNGAKIGTQIHNTFKIFYESNEIFDYDKFIEIFNKQTDLNELDKRSMIKNFANLNSVFKSLIDDGYRNLHNELEVTTEFNGQKITGFIDRIDKNDIDYLIIDYKNRSKNKIKEDKFIYLQLEFYRLLLSLSKKIEPSDIKVKFLSIIDCEILDPTIPKKDPLSVEKELENFISLLNTEISFDKCDDSNSCRYCAYKILCNKDCS